MTRALQNDALRILALLSASATGCGPTKGSGCARSRRSTGRFRDAAENAAVVLDGGTRGSISSIISDGGRRAARLRRDRLRPRTGNAEARRGATRYPQFTGAEKMSLHQTGFQEVLCGPPISSGGYPRRIALVGCHGSTSKLGDHWPRAGAGWRSSRDQALAAGGGPSGGGSRSRSARPARKRGAGCSATTPIS